MKPTKSKYNRKGQAKWVVLAALAASAVGANAQSADALIDKLVDKGILSVKEGNDLRQEADKNFSSAYSVKSGMPDWVTALKFNGDVRARYEGFYSDASVTSGAVTSQFVDRNRFRYRLRFGVTATLVDDFEVGMKLISDDAATGPAGGDPISGNTTFQDNGTKKLIYLDQVYGRWTPLNGPNWTARLTVGKMESPFVISDMILDPDYTPEGGAVQLGYMFNDKHTLKLNGGGFVLDENGATGKDPYLVAAQLRWDAVWNPKWTSTLGLSSFSILGPSALTIAAVPNQNTGNTRNAFGAPAYQFNPFIVDSGVTYMLDSFPMYPGAFPIKVAGEYVNNPAAPSMAGNYGWNAGVVFGKSGKKGTWDLSYNYKYLGANAWYEELADSDFGGIYAIAPAGTPYSTAGDKGSGYQAGTNVKGHIIRFAYSPTDSLTLSVKWFLTSLIKPFPGTSESEVSRVQIDALWKF